MANMLVNVIPSYTASTILITKISVLVIWQASYMLHTMLFVIPGWYSRLPVCVCPVIAFPCGVFRCCPTSPSHTNFNGLSSFGRDSGHIPTCHLGGSVLWYSGIKWAVGANWRHWSPQVMNSSPELRDLCQFHRGPTPGVPATTTRTLYRILMGVSGI